MEKQKYIEQGESNNEKKQGSTPYSIHRGVLNCHPIKFTEGGIELLLFFGFGY